MVPTLTSLAFCHKGRGMGDTEAVCPDSETLRENNRKIYITIKICIIIDPPGKEFLEESQKSRLKPEFF